MSGRILDVLRLLELGRVRHLHAVAVDAELLGVAGAADEDRVDWRQLRTDARRGIRAVAALGRQDLRHFLLGHGLRRFTARGVRLLGGQETGLVGLGRRRLLAAGALALGTLGTLALSAFTFVALGLGLVHLGLGLHRHLCVALGVEARLAVRWRLQVEARGVAGGALARRAGTLLKTVAAEARRHRHEVGVRLIGLAGRGIGQGELEVLDVRNAVVAHRASGVDLGVRRVIDLDALAGSDVARSPCCGTACTASTSSRATLRSRR